MRTVVHISMALVAVAAFALSFQSLMELGALAGYGRLAFLYPVVVDLGTVSSCTAWLATRSKQAFWMTWTLLGISVVQNGTVHWLIATSQRPEWWLVTLVATVPPLVLGLTVHLGVGLSSRALPDEKTSNPVLNENRVENRLDEEHCGADRVGPRHVLDENASSDTPSSGQEDRAEAQPGSSVVGQSSTTDPVEARIHDVNSGPVAELLAQGAGRRKLAEALNISEHAARKLVDQRRNGHANV